MRRLEMGEIKAAMYGFGGRGFFAFTRLRAVRRHVDHALKRAISLTATVAAAARNMVCPGPPTPQKQLYEGRAVRVRDGKGPRV